MSNELYILTLTVSYPQAVPMSSFISHCEATWIKMSAGKTDSNIMSDNYRISPLICGHKSFSQPTKRMLQRKDIDVVLLGSLKVSHLLVFLLLPNIYMHFLKDSLVSFRK